MIFIDFNSRGLCWPGSVPVLRDAGNPPKEAHEPGGWVGGGSEGLLNKTVLRCCQLKPVAVAVSCLSEDLGDIFSLARMKGCRDFSCSVFLCVSECTGTTPLEVLGCCTAISTLWSLPRKWLGLNKWKERVQDGFSAPCL